MAFDPYKRIAELEEMLVQRDARIAVLEAENRQLRDTVSQLVARIEYLESRLNRNSGNSGTPPSANPPGAPKSPPKTPSGRKPGGQPGHPGSHRPMVPPDKSSDHYPETCCHCHTPLVGQSHRDPLRHQVTELAPICVFVTEYRLHSLTCDQCGGHTRATLPQGVPTGHFGPRLTAAVAMMSSRFRLTRREVPACCDELFGTKLAVGSVQHLCEQTSEALAVPVADVLDEILADAVIHADETGYPHRGQKAWLWVATTRTATAFRLHAKRGHAALDHLIPRTYQGVVVSDRWHIYKRFKNRALCHAHLLRNWKAISERKHADAKRLGHWAMAETVNLLRWHRQYRDGQLPCEGMFRRMWLLQGRYKRMLKQALASDDPETAKLARSLTKYWEALWTFVKTPGVEPTNNNGERKLRPGVLLRKGSFGTWSEGGQRFVDRGMTVAATAKQQGVRLFDFLHAAVEAKLNHRPAPSLFAARDRSPPVLGAA